MAKKTENTETNSEPAFLKTEGEKLAERVLKAVTGAEGAQSKLDEKSMIITQLDNNPVMATRKTRHLFNNLGAGSKKYLEVGTYMGGSAVAVGYKNKNVKGWTIDNFSEFHGVENSEVAEIARKNLKLTDNIKLLQEDSFKVDLSQFKDIDLFFYDGDHSEFATYTSIKKYSSTFADSVIIVIDDWNWQQVQGGGLRALNELANEGWIIRFKLHLEGAYDAQYEKDNEWGYWNGLLICALEKNKTRLITKSTVPTM